MRATGSGYWGFSTPKPPEDISAKGNGQAFSDGKSFQQL